ncbi:MAG: ribokinase [Muribaculaceae bacterium]|nr:ribokinase [Muribaculaceae bacterium]MDE6831915.1 ribokinase [Muribaculaceae bacterium]
MNKPDIVCIGHITLDKIITPRLEAYSPGGTAFYFAHALAGLDHSGFKLVTSLALSEMNAVDDIRAEGIDVEVIPSRRSVYFENKYGENQNDRRQRVLAKADPFTVDNLAPVDGRIFHLGTLLADDFSLDAIRMLSAKGIVSVDAQGYLREVRGEQVHPIDWADKLEALKYIDILKANEKEMETLTGTTDPRQAARILADWGCREVLLTLGDHGSLIYADGRYIEIPAYPTPDVVDATGCGDTYMAGYLYSRSRGATYEEAGRFAAAMCTLKLGHSGPFRGSEAAVRAVIDGK